MRFTPATIFALCMALPTIGLGQGDLIDSFDKTSFSFAAGKGELYVHSALAAFHGHRSECS